MVLNAISRRRAGLGLDDEGVKLVSACRLLQQLLYFSAPGME